MQKKAESGVEAHIRARGYAALFDATGTLIRVDEMNSSHGDLGGRFHWFLDLSRMVDVAAQLAFASAYFPAALDRGAPQTPRRVMLSAPP